MKTMLFAEPCVAQDEKNQKIKWNNYRRKVTRFGQQEVISDLKK